MPPEGRSLINTGRIERKGLLRNISMIDRICSLRLTCLQFLQGEEHFEGDELLDGGVRNGLHNGTNYTEERRYKQDNTIIMFYFVTRCYNNYVQSILDGFKLEPPQIIIMNSCLWDLHRYGKTAHEDYITNMQVLLRAIDLAVPAEDSLFIWNATLPVRETVNAGFLAPGMTQTIPADDIRKANLFVRDMMQSYTKCVFLDLHLIFIKHLGFRVKDGVHWNDFAHRKITCLILLEISKYWNHDAQSKEPLPVFCAHKTSCPIVSYNHSKNADLQSRSFEQSLSKNNGYVSSSATHRGPPSILSSSHLPSPQEHPHFSDYHNNWVRRPQFNNLASSRQNITSMNRFYARNNSRPMLHGSLRYSSFMRTHLNHPYHHGQSFNGHFYQQHFSSPSAYNNNNYVKNLNETYPSATIGKRKRHEDGNFTPYKFPRFNV